MGVEQRSTNANYACDTLMVSGNGNEKESGTPRTGVYAHRSNGNIENELPRLAEPFSAQLRPPDTIARLLIGAPGAEDRPLSPSDLI